MKEESDRITVERHIEDFAQLFENAPAFNIELSYAEIATIITAFAAGGEYLFFFQGNDLDEVFPIMDSVKAKFQTALQQFLDAQEPQY